MVSKRVDGAAFSYLEFVNDEAVGHTNFRIFRHPILKDIGTWDTPRPRDDREQSRRARAVLTRDS